MNHYKHNEYVLSGDTYLSTDDVLLQPSYGKVASRSDIPLWPYIYSAPMDTVTDINSYFKFLNNGVIPVLSRIFLDKIIKCINFDIERGDINLELYFQGFFSIGSSIEDFEKIKKLYNSLNVVHKPNLKIAVDIAHGWSVNGMDQIKRLQDLGIRNIMSGSIATPEAVVELFDAGTTHVRAGIGGGAMCSTRVMTGCGVPNLSNIFTLYKEIRDAQRIGKDNMVLIADSGIKNPGDIVKYISAGADAVMIGTLFASCSDSPAPLVDGKKIHRGQASRSFQVERLGTLRNNCAEGIEKALTPDITIKEKVEWIDGGVRSAISYLGQKKLSDLNPRNVKFLRTSHASLSESYPMK